MTRALMLILMLALGGCQTSGSTDSGDHQSLTLCDPDNRPEICTREYRPVCAKVDSGVRCVKEPCPSFAWKTMATGCTACSQQGVIGWVEGACEMDSDHK